MSRGGPTAGGHKAVKDILPVQEGSNLLEIVDFRIRVRVGGRIQEELYGVNVAKTIELLYCPDKITAVPSASDNPAQLGLVVIRDQTIPVFDMGRFIGLSGAEPLSGPVFDEGGKQSRTTLLVTEFSRLKLGFLVHRVARIRRFSWDDVKPGDGLLEGAERSRRVVGVVMVPGETAGATEKDSQILQIIDLEAVAEAAGFFSKQEDEINSMVQESPRNQTILVVDDSAAVRKAIAKSLDRAGFTTVQASNGKQAWDILAKGLPVDLVLSDVEMPEMDGYTLTAKIRGNQGLSTLPVVLNSSMSGEANKQKGQAAGASDYIVKMDVPCILETLDKHLSQKSTGGDGA